MRPQYSDLLKRKVAEVLHEAPRGQLKWIAKALDVTDRTLRHWRRSYPVMPRRGRPANEISIREKIAIGREWKKQGCPGSRPIISGTGLSARKVRRVIADLKSQQKQRAELHRKKAQVRVKVQKAKVFGVMDGASLSKGDDYLVYRDRGSLSVEAKVCGGHLKAEHTLVLLEELKAQGRLPLVIGTDNGSPFCANSVLEFLEKNQVIHLRSLPCVPQQNGSAENAVKEFKKLAKQGLAGQACQMLNQWRRRPSLGWKTSGEYDVEAIPPDQKTRSSFYQAAQANIKAAVLGIQSVYAKRQAEREAILQTMEDFELIIRTRGDLPLRAKAEAIA